MNQLCKHLNIQNLKLKLCQEDKKYIFLHLKHKSYNCYHMELKNLYQQNSH